jgi:Protein of unknown function (DUF1236)
MWVPLCRRLRLILMIGCVVGAAAIGLGSDGLSGRDAAAMEDEDTTGSRPDGRAGRELELSEEQRSRIYESVMKMPNSPTAAVPPADIAEALPSGVPLQDLPAAVTREVPLLGSHKFVKFDDRILLVDPSSRRVVAMIPRYRLLQ